MNTTRISNRFRLLLAFAGAATFAVILFACGGGGGGGDDDDTPKCGTCDAPNMCCDIGGNDFCINTASDVQNCGGCGQQCNTATADTCGGSACKCGAGPECGPGQGCCDGGCRDTQNDNNNCGGCGVVCGDGTTCSNGTCLCGGVACNGGESCCNNQCVNTQSDAANCGMCGKTCDGVGAACNGGQCGCEGGGTACPAMADGVIPMCCETGCVDICNDAANCGGCGQSCAIGACFFGGCVGTTDPLPDCLALPM